MRLFLFCSDMIIPVIILGIVCYGVTQHVDVYESFIKGANSGFQTVIKIMPTMLALMIAVGILRASGLLEAIGMWIGSMTDHIGFPGELVPLTVVKMSHHQRQQVCYWICIKSMEQIQELDLLHPSVWRVRRRYFIR